MNPRLVMLSVVMGILAVVCNAGKTQAQEDVCTEIRLDVERRSERLGDYINALHEAHRRGDFILIKAFCHKISLLVEDLERAQQAANCPEIASGGRRPALGPIKTDATEYVTDSCPELRRTQVKLLRQVSALKWRTGAVFSELSAQEKSKLEAAEAELAKVSHVLKARCTAETPRRTTRPRAGKPVREAPGNR